MKYFSDRELGEKVRSEKIITPTVWGGITAMVQSLISTGAFGKHFPAICPDGSVTIGTDEEAFAMALKAEVPDIDWPLATATKVKEGLLSEYEPYSPETLAILDLIQFCYMHVAKPIQVDYHDFFKHHHLSFEVDKGKNEFREKINRIFSRNGLSFELGENGEVKRLSAPVIGEEFESIKFNTGDKKLNEILEDSRNKYLNPDPEIHREAVERLWDAWERLKTLENPSDKKKSIKYILDKTASETNFRELLKDEAKKLTDIGNSFHIRHSEITQIEINELDHYDYLFHRLLSMVLLLIKSIA